MYFVQVCVCVCVCVCVHHIIFVTNLFKFLPSNFTIIINIQFPLKLIKSLHNINAHSCQMISCPPKVNYSHLCQWVMSDEGQSVQYQFQFLATLHPNSAWMTWVPHNYNNGNVYVKFRILETKFRQYYEAYHNVLRSFINRNEVFTYQVKQSGRKCRNSRATTIRL